MSAVLWLTTGLVTVRLAIPWAQSSLGLQDDHHEQHDSRNSLREFLKADCAQSGIVGDVANCVGLGQTQDERTEERSRKAAQLADDCHRVGVYEQQGQACGTERLLRSNQNTGDGGHHRPEGPCQSRCPTRSTTVELQEAPVIDHCTHCDSETRRPEDQSQSGGYEYRYDHRHDALVGDRHPEQVDRLTREERWRGSGHRWRPDELCQGHETDHQRNGDDDLDHFCGALDPPHDPAFDHRPEKRCNDEHHERHGRPERYAPPLVNLPEHEGRHH